MSECTVQVLDDLVRTRRTVKEFGPDPVPREVLDELFELARWAPTHRMTEPWRFRVLGPEALASLKVAAGAGAAKFDRAPTLIVASVVPSPVPLHAEEDMHAGAIASYIVLLAAHARGYAGYWRTPAVLRMPEGRTAAAVPSDERVLGLIQLGRPVSGVLAQAPMRRGVAEFVSYLS